MKKTYTAPKVEISVFKNEDIITTSFVGTGTQSDIKVVGNVVTF